jgi:hypothetical protein
VDKTRNRLPVLRIVVAALALVVVVAGTGRAQSLEEQTRRPRGSNTLHDDSQRNSANGNITPPPTDSLDNDSMRNRGRSPDEDGTNSLDDGSMDGGDGPDSR